MEEVPVTRLVAIEAVRKLAPRCDAIDLLKIALSHPGMSKVARADIIAGLNPDERMAIAKLQLPAIDLLKLAIGASDNIDQYGFATLTNQERMRLSDLAEYAGYDGHQPSPAECRTPTIRDADNLTVAKLGEHADSLRKLAIELGTAEIIRICNATINSTLDGERTNS